jgi:spore germination protein
MTARRRRVSRRTAWRLAVASLAAAVVVAAGAALAIGPSSREGAGGPGEADLGAGPDRGQVTRIGYVPYWDQARAFDVVWRQPDLFDEVSPVWYSLEPTGEVVLADATHTTVDRRAVGFLREHGIRVIPTVSNLRDGEWQPDLVRAMLHDPEAMRAHVRELVALAVQEGYDGIDIDYEHLRGQDRTAFSAFLTELGAALRAEGRVLTVAVHPKSSDEGDSERNLAQDYRAIGAAADQVRVMTYDYSWESSPPGPVAPAEWVEDVIAWTVTQIPPEKVILGVVLLGYEWAHGRGSTVDYQQARAAARAHDVDIRRSGDGSPWFRYVDRSGTAHEVWFEDEVSVEAKLRLVSRYGLGGVFFWRLGGEDPAVWRLVAERA